MCPGSIHCRNERRKCWTWVQILSYSYFLNIVAGVLKHDSSAALSWIKIRCHSGLPGLVGVLAKLIVLNGNCLVCCLQELNILILGVTCGAASQVSYNCWVSWAFRRSAFSGWFWVYLSLIFEAIKMRSKLWNILWKMCRLHQFVCHETWFFYVFFFSFLPRTILIWTWDNVLQIMNILLS